MWILSFKYLKTNSGTEGLKGDQGNLTNNDQSKATILKKYFAFMFTEEDLSTVSQPVPPNEHTEDDLTITEEMAMLKPTQLQSTSSPGPDNIHPINLKETAHQLAKSLSMIYKSINTACLPDDWKLGEMSQYSRKATDRNLEIIDQWKFPFAVADTACLWNFSAGSR